MGFRINSPGYRWQVFTQRTFLRQAARPKTDYFGFVYCVAYANESAFPSLFKLLFLISLFHDYDLFPCQFLPALWRLRPASSVRSRPNKGFCRPILPGCVVCTTIMESFSSLALFASDIIPVWPHITVLTAISGWFSCSCLDNLESSLISSSCEASQLIFGAIPLNKFRSTTKMTRDRYTVESNVASSSTHSRRDAPAVDCLCIDPDERKSAEF